MVGGVRWVGSRLLGTEEMVVPTGSTRSYEGRSRSPPTPLLPLPSGTPPPVPFPPTFTNTLSIPFSPSVSLIVAS